MKAKTFCSFVRSLYQTDDFIPLHAPSFSGNEKQYVLDTIDSTFVSSVGQYVNQFEENLSEYTGVSHAVATVNGTSGLHASLFALGVGSKDFVITQALTFVATCNAISHLGAEPIFLDVSEESMGLSPSALESFLMSEAEISEVGCIHKASGRRIRGVLPMHTFGHPAELDELKRICDAWCLFLLEDAAESLGSLYKGRHTGTFGDAGVLSFNGNKIITTGGGGAVLCNNAQLGAKIKHLTTTAKVAHAYEFNHDEVAFNYRMPNLNAALGCAQLESLDSYLASKREIAMKYKAFFDGSDCRFVDEPSYARSNFWLNAVRCENIEQRNYLLQETNALGVMTRPVWKLMADLPMYGHCVRDDLFVSREFAEQIVNIPSSPQVNAR